MGGVQKYPDLTKALTSLEVTATIGLAVFITYERYHVGETSQYFKYLNHYQKVLVLCNIGKKKN